MMIKGFLERKFEPPAPFVRAVVVSRVLNASRLVDFHVDTGASASIILDKDLRYLGLDLGGLKRAERDVGGIGGLIRTYVIEDAALIFRAVDGSVVEERLKLLVGSHEIGDLDVESKRLMMVIPSLLGRDILGRFKLVYNERTDDVYLER
jgi:hypothetical protein